MDAEELVALTLSCGADKAVALDQNRIRLSANFRSLCQANACGNYDRCWTCPPEIGDIEDLMAELRTYPHGVLYQTIHALEDSYDVEGMEEAAVKHRQVGQKLQELLQGTMKNKFLNLSCGRCQLCETCAKITKEPCRFPDKALPSISGYGVDVYRTVKGTGLKYINGEDTVTYFGMILYTE